MNFFEYFYCKAYNYYDIKKYKKSNETLRVSAISLLSMFQAFNILTAVFSFSLIYNNIIDKWYGIILAIIVAGYNLYKINIAKSALLLKEFEAMPPTKNSKMKMAYHVYLAVSILSFVMLCFIYK